MAGRSNPRIEENAAATRMINKGVLDRTSKVRMLKAILNNSFFASGVKRK